MLVSYLRNDMASNEAGLKFFILGIFAAGLLAYGISLVFGETGKLVFSEMSGAAPTTGLVIGFLLIFAALGFKIGAVPFHSWIPDTYQGAPTPVTALQNIFWPRQSRGWSRLAIAFAFGLFHGLGFAGGLRAAMTEMPTIARQIVLLSFSLGVEIGN